LIFEPFFDNPKSEIRNSLMCCRDFRKSLSLYLDDALAPPVKLSAEEHLRFCPVCRAELTQMRRIKDALRQIEKPALSFDFQNQVKNRVGIELAARAEIKKISQSAWEQFWDKYLQPQILPYATGVMASFLLFALLFVSLAQSINVFRQMEEQARIERRTRERLLAAAIPSKPYDEMPILPAADYSVRRLSIANESPSLNPQSSFVALTASLTKNEPKNAAIIVVADVLSNGIAQISEVIRPPKDSQKIAELEKLLREDPAFVPASLDRRPDNVRVVLMIQKVDVRETNGTQKIAKNRKL
jgi:hypothetical protein